VRIGYPVLNLSLDPPGGKPLPLLARSPKRVIEQTAKNIAKLAEVLKWNLARDLLFFRIPPDLIPFASDPKVDFDWQESFGPRLSEIGAFARAHGMRLSVHPDLFVMLNHPDKKQLNQSIRELWYLADLFDAMGLDADAKVQIHAGERFGKDKEKSMGAFVERFTVLEDRIKRRLVIENENVLCTVRDCLAIHIRTGIPIVPDALHHEITAGDEGIRRVFEQCAETWGECDGPMMADYSSQQPGKMSGKHSETLDPAHFRAFVEATRDFDFDLMMENKDREKSALSAREILKDDPRLSNRPGQPPEGCR